MHRFASIGCMPLGTLSLVHFWLLPSHLFCAGGRRILYKDFLFQVLDEVLISILVIISHLAGCTVPFSPLLELM